MINETNDKLYSSKLTSQLFKSKLSIYLIIDPSSKLSEFTNQKLLNKVELRKEKLYEFIEKSRMSSNYLNLSNENFINYLNQILEEGDKGEQLTKLLEKMKMLQKMNWIEIIVMSNLNDALHVLKIITHIFKKDEKYNADLKRKIVDNEVIVFVFMLLVKIPKALKKNENSKMILDSKMTSVFKDVLVNL